MAIKSGAGEGRQGQGALNKTVEMNFQILSALESLREDEITKKNSSLC